MVRKRKNPFSDKKADARTIVFIAIALFATAIIFFTSHYAINTTINNMTSMSIINESNDTVEIMETTPELTNRLDYIVFAFFIAFILSLLISSWFIGGHPIFMFIYFLVAVITVALSAVLTNVWDNFTSMSIFSPTTTVATHFPIANHLIGNLPIYMAIIAFIGIVVMFAKPSPE